jgi:hypothetical protein
MIESIIRVITVYCLVYCVTLPGAFAAEFDETLIEDFEGEGFQGWEVTGTAFGQGSTENTLPNQTPVTGFRGKGFVNSHHGGEGGMGTITSPLFTIERDYIDFLINGGHHPLRQPLSTGHRKTEMVYIGLGSFKHAVFDDIVVERDGADASHPEVLFSENFDAMGQSGGIYGIDPEVWDVGADDGDAVPWPPLSGTTQEGVCYSRLWNLGGGDWCFFDRNGGFKARRLMTI